MIQHRIQQLKEYLFDSSTTTETNSDASTSSELSDSSVLAQSLNNEQIQTTIDILEPLIETPNEPEQIEEVLPSLDFHELEETRLMLSASLEGFQGQYLKSKDRNVDAVEVVVQTLDLILQPMAARKDTENALTDAQANRFAVQQYTPKELIEQHAAGKQAYSALTVLHPDYNPQQQASDSRVSNESSTTDERTPDSTVTENPVLDDIDFSKSELVWGKQKTKSASLDAFSNMDSSAKDNSK